jgi:PAS domain S-box-containing protein
MTTRNISRPLDKILLTLLWKRLLLPSLLIVALMLGLSAQFWGRHLSAWQLQLARSMVYQVDDHLNNASHALGGIAEAAGSTDLVNLRTYMRATWRTHQTEFDAIYYLNREGVVKALVPPDPQYDGIDMSRHPYFAETEASNQPTISSSFRSPRTGLPAVYIAWPMAQGGMIVGEVNLIKFQTIIESEENWEFFIVDRNGMLLAHPNTDWVDQQVNVRHLKIVERGLKDEATMFYSTGESWMLGSTTRCERTDWTVVVQIPLTAIYSPYAFAVGLGLAMATITWLATILTLRKELERFVVTPITRLNKITATLSNGAFAEKSQPHPLPTAFAELAALQANFHRMSQTIQAREKALRESERKYRLILQNIQDGYYETDLKGNLVFFNNALCRILGYTAEDLKGVNYQSLMSPADAERTFETFNAIYRTGRPARAVEGKIIQKSGAEQMIEVSTALIVDAQGAPMGFRGIARDITKRKRAEREIKRRTAQLEALRQVGLELTAQLDLDALLHSIVSQATRLLGGDGGGLSLYVPEENGLQWTASAKHLKPLKTLLHWGEGLNGKVWETGKPIIVDNYTHWPDRLPSIHEDYPFSSIVGVPIRWADQFLGVLTIMSEIPGAFSSPDADLLELFAAQAAVAIENAQLYHRLRDYADQLETRVMDRTAQLQTEYARLDAILKSASDGVIVTDVQGEITQANPVANMWINQTLSPQDSERLQAAVRELATQTRPIDPANDRRPVGETSQTILELTGLDLALQSSPILSDDPETATVVVIHDVSHLKALDRMKSRFVTNVSHELRTPVTTIKLYASLLKKTSPGDDKWEEYLEALTKEADHQARLVQDILHISHIDAGRLEMKTQLTSLHELTYNVIDNRRPLAERQGLEMAYHPATPDPTILVDPARMRQVLNNLIENAIRYTPAGGRVTISTERVRSEGRKWAAIHIADTGIGIPEDEIPHIFERFFRGAEPRAMQISGTGLGLAIAQEITELHGGHITVQSRVEEGTTLTIWLPLAGHEQSLLAVENHQQQKQEVNL